jgi:hypothetical protein
MVLQLLDSPFQEQLLFFDGSHFSLQLFDFLQQTLVDLFQVLFSLGLAATATTLLKLLFEGLNLSLQLFDFLGLNSR